MALNEPERNSAITGRFKWVGLFAAISAITLVAYWPAIKGTFIWNDLDYVTKPELRSIDGLKRIWSEIGATEQYYPLLHSAFWIQHKLWADSHVGYHLLSVLAHAIAACLLAALMQRLRLKGSWLAAGLFALHPVHVESVAWISEQKNTLSTVFYLWACLAYFQFTEKRRAATWWFGLLLFVVAIMCKSVAATLVPAILVVIWWQRGRLDWNRDVVPLLPWFVVGAGFALFTGWVEFKIIGANGPDFALGALERLVVAGRAAWFYLGNVVWPTNLMFIYPRWEVRATDAWQWLFPISAVGLIVACWLIRRQTRAPLATLLLFGGTLFPTIGFFNIYAFIFSYVADHWQYLANLAPIAGISALWGEWRARSQSRLASAAAGGLIVVFFGMTWQQAHLYSDIERFYRLTLQKNPRCWMAHNNLGLLLAERGQTSEAIEHYRLALEIKPDNVLARANLGSSLAKNPASRHEGILELREAVRQQPNFSMAHTNLAEALAKEPSGVAEALSSYRRALALDPHNSHASNNLANLLARLPGGQMEAFALFERTLTDKPFFAGGHFNYGTHLAKVPGREDDAIVHLTTAVKINPDYYEAHLNLAELLDRLPGRDAEAAKHFKEAIRIRPDSADAKNNLGVWHAKRGELTEAVKIFEAALRIDPENEGARQNLAIARIQLGSQREN